MSARLPRTPRVAVVIEASNAYARGLLEGIHRHLREHEPWTVFLPEHGRGTPPLEQLAGWRGEGIIVRVETPAIADVLCQIRKQQKTPCVDVSAARLLPGIPYVETDDEAIGQSAAAHFAERDFRHYGFLGDERFRWSQNRCRAFIAALQDRGYAVNVFSSVERRRGRRRSLSGGDQPDEDEAIARANNTEFGLGAGIMTENLGRAHRVADRLQAGNVWINSYNLIPPGLPFGGSKQSGIGREGSIYALEAYTEVKATFIQL